MSGHCRRMMGALNEAIAVQQFSPALLAMSNPSAGDVLNAITAVLPEEMRDDAREEFGSLPRAFLLTFWETLHDAVGAGMPFKMISEPPAEPIDAAREGRVEWRHAYDRGGVKMIVSHVHNHHAAWFSAVKG